MYRQDKINEEVTRELTMILRNVKDPRVSGAFICISAAEVTRDLSYAKVYYSVLGKGAEEAAKGLESASGFIRRELASRLNLRITPKLIFIKDDSSERAMNISKILKDIGLENNE